MRTLTIVLALVLLIVGSCGKKADEEPQIVSDRMVPDDEKLMLAASTRLIDSFGKQLKTELMSALSEGGPENAISVCQVTAPQIALANSGEFWTIKRVSNRNRNSGNLATDHEISIMARFKDAVGGAPEFTFEWTRTDEGIIFRYYRPIKIAPLGVKCHGSAKDISDAVQAVLNEKYPQDRAVGYKPGDLRGLFVVEARWPDGRPFADSVLKTGPQLP